MSRARRLLATPPFTALGLVTPLLAPCSSPPATSLPPLRDDAHRLRLVTNNALKGNRRPAPWAEAVLALAPDVLVLQEATDALVAGLDRAGVADLLPHAFVHDGRGDGGCALWSRTPLTDERLIDTEYPGLVATVEVDGTAVTVVGAHPYAPVAPWDAPRWRRAFATVAEVVGAVAGPVICAGDWNATLAHEPLVELLERTGLVDAHTAAGRPRARTWPSPGQGGPLGVLPPVALLDRVLVSGLAVAGIAEETVPGSDHRAVVADLALP